MLPHLPQLGVAESGLLLEVFQAWRGQGGAVGANLCPHHLISQLLVSVPGTVCRMHPIQI